jgi:hypothetical protein
MMLYSMHDRDFHEDHVMIYNIYCIANLYFLFSADFFHLTNKFSIIAIYANNILVGARVVSKLKRDTKVQTT